MTTLDLASEQIISAAKSALRASGDQDPSTAKAVSLAINFLWQSLSDEERETLSIAMAPVSLTMERQMS